MRRLAILIFAVLLHDIFVPHPTPISALSDGRPAVATLDVCHSPLSQLTDDDMPGATEPPGLVTPALSFEYCREDVSEPFQLLLSLQNEDPPEA